MSTQQITAVVAIIKAVAETIQEMGPQGAPSGVLYAALMGKGCSFALYTQIVDILLKSGRVTQSNNVLYWLASPGTEAK